MIPIPSIRSRRTVPLRAFLTLPFILLIIAIVGLTGWLSLRDSQRSLDYLTWHLMDEVGDRVEQQLTRYLETPQQINQINVDATQNGLLDPTDLPQMERHLISQIQQFPSVSTILFGSPEGELRMVHRNRLAGDRLELGVVAADAPETLMVYDMTPGRERFPNRQQAIATLQSFDVRERDWYRRAVATRQPGWSEIMPMGIDSSLGINAYHPVYAPSDNTLQGVFSVNLSLLDLQNFLQSTALAEQGRVFISDQDGHLLASSAIGIRAFLARPGDAEAEFRRLTPGSSGDALMAATERHLNQQGESLATLDNSPNGAENLNRSKFFWNGEQHFVQVRSFQVPGVEGNDSPSGGPRDRLRWQIVEVVPESAFMAGFNDHAVQTILLVSLATLGAIALGSGIAYWVTRPIHRLGTAAAAIADGEMEQQIPEQFGIRELDQMARSFNWMAQQVQVAFHRIQFAQRSSEEKFSKIFRSSPDPMSISALEDGRFLDVNDSFCQYTGYTYDELVGRTTLETGIWARDDGQDQQRRQQFVQQLKAEGRVYDIELPYTSKTGEQKIWVFSAELIELDGEPCILGVGKDVSDRRQAEAEYRRTQEVLRERERQLSTLISNLPGVAYRCRNESAWSFEFVSDGVQKLMGYPPQALVDRGMTFADIIHPDDQDWRRAAVQAALENRQPFQITYRILTTKGREKWVWEQGRGIFTGSGEVTALEGFMVDITGQKRAEMALMAGEARYRAILAAIPDMMLLFNADGRFLESIRTSDTLIDLMDHLPADINPVGRHLTELLPSELANRQLQAIQTAIATGNVQTFVNTVQILDSFSETEELVTQHEEVRVSPVDDHTVLVMVRDIGDRHRAEQALLQSERLFRSLFEQAGVGITLAVPESGEFIRVNQKFCELLGYTEGELLQTTWRDITHPDDLVAELSYDPPLWSQQIPSFSMEKRYRHKDGSYCWVHMTASNLFDEAGIPRQTLAIIQDIGDRKRMEQELLQHQRFIERITDATSAMLYVYDLAENRNIYVNNRSQEMLGYSPAEVQAMGANLFPRIMHPEDMPNVIDNLRRCQTLQDGEWLEVEYRIRHASGEWRWLFSRDCVLTRDANGTPRQLMGTAIDITDRKRLEADLQEQQMLFCTLIETIPDPIYLKDGQGRWLLVNQAGLDAFQLAGDVYRNRTDTELADLLPPYRDAFLACAASDEAAWNQGTQSRIEESFEQEDGTCKTFDVRKVPLFNPDGSRQWLVVIGRDISNLKAVEADLRQNNHLLDRILQSAPQVIYLHDRQTEENLYVSNQLQVILGYTPEEVQQPGKGFYDTMHPDDRHLFQGYGERLNQLQDGEFIEIEYRQRHAGGHWLWLRSRDVVFERDVTGQPSKILGTAIDITHQKQAEQQLQVQSAALDASANAIVITDCHGNIEWVNPAFAALTGYTPEEALGKNPSELLKSGIQSREFYQALWRTILSGQVWHGELVNRRKDGRLYDEEMTITPVRNPQGEIQHFIAIKQDISQRKTLTRELQASQAQLQDIIHNAGAGIIRLRIYADMTWRYDFYSPSCEQLYGYSPEELIADRGLWRSRVHPEDFEQVIIPTIQALVANRTDDSQDIEYRFHHRDGSWRWIAETNTSRYDDLEDAWVVTLVAIDITERKQAEQQVQFQAQLLDAVQQAVIASDQAGRITYWNPAAEQLFGWSAQDTLGQSVMDLTVGDMQAEHALEVIQTLQRGTTWSGEFTLRRQDGSTFPALVTDSPIWNDRGELVGIIGITTDITALKQVETALREKEAQTQAILNAIPDLITLVNRDGIRLWIENRNSQVTDLMTIQEGFSGNYHLAAMLPPAVAETKLQLLARVLETGELQTCEQRVWVDEQWRYEEVRGVACGEDKVLFLIRDITDRKRAEKALQESEEKFRAIFENSMIGIVLASAPNFHLALCNDAFLNILGYSQAELATMQFSEFTHPDDLAMEMRLVDECFAGERDSYQIEKRYIHKDGSPVWVSLTSSVVRDDQGEIIYSIALAKDISDRKQAEAELQRAYEMRRTIENAIAEGIATVDQEGRQTYVNPSFCKMVGWSEAELLGATPPFVYWPPEEIDNINHAFQICLEGRRPPEGIELRFMRRNGERFDVLLLDAPILDQQGNITAWLASVIDITERKRAAEALRLSEFRLREAQRIAHVGNWEFDFGTERLIWSDELCRIHGLAVDTEPPTGEAALSYIHPDDRDRYIQEIYEPAINGLTFHVDLRIIRPDGEIRHISTRGEPIFDAAGNLIKIFGTTLDITDQKYYEESLRRYERIVSATSDGIALFDQDYRFQLLNDAYLAKFGRPHAEIIHQPLPDLVGREFFETTIKPFLDRALTGEQVAFETWYDYPALGPRFLSVIYSPYQEPDGRISGAIASIRDLTELRQAELALRQSEEQFRQIADNIQDVFFLKSIDGDLLYVNPASDRLYGQSSDETAESPDAWLDCIHPDDRERLAQHLARQRSLQEFSEIEYRVIAPNGEVHWVSDRAFPIRDDQGRVYRYAGLNRDITPRKLAELELRKSLREKEVMLAEIHHRVKNNLQVISSLLDLQAIRTADPDTRLALDDSRNRVNAMAIVHEKLYRSRDFTQINALDYIEGLVNYLLQTYYPPSGQVSLALRVDPAQTIPLAQAVPVGLILNELVTNSLKYGFVGRSGHLYVWLANLEESHLRLTVGNDGDTLPSDFDLQSDISSMGLQLVLELVAQLEGDIDLERGERTLFHITFSLEF
jgi:PAS domain S-box-containing protein